MKTMQTYTAHTLYRNDTHLTLARLKYHDSHKANPAPAALKKDPLERITGFSRNERRLRLAICIGIGASLASIIIRFA